MLVFSHSIVAILRSEEVFIIASVFTPPSGMASFILSAPALQPRGKRDLEF